MSYASPDGTVREPYLSVRIGGRTPLGIGRRATLALAAAVAAVALWGCAAGLFFWFHDGLLAALMARQADMQYGYEDQIAELRTELDRQASRTLVDRRTIETTMRDVEARSRQLEEHAAALDALVGDVTARSAAARSPRDGAHDGRGAPAVHAAVGVLPERTAPSSGAEDHAAAEPAAIAGRLAALDQRQAAVALALREPLARRAHRLAAALAQAGLSKRAETLPAMGGPFVPLDGKASTFDSEIALARDALDQARRLDAVVDRVPLRKPLVGPIDVSSPYGARLDPFFGRPALHTGVDLLDSADGVVRATAAGVVTAAGESGGYGRMVEVDHGDGLVTRYAHLASFDVARGQHVAAGVPLGIVGATGRATGPHLHYETRVNGEPVDPLRFLAAGARVEE